MRAAFRLANGHGKYFMRLPNRLHPFLRDHPSSVVRGEAIQLIVLSIQLEHHEIAPGTLEFVLEIIWLISIQVGFGATQRQKHTNRVRIEKRAFDINFVLPGKNGIAIFCHQPWNRSRNSIRSQAGHHGAKTSWDFQQPRRGICTNIIEGIELEREKIEGISCCEDKFEEAIHP